MVSPCVTTLASIMTSLRDEPVTAMLPFDVSTSSVEGAADRDRPHFAELLVPVAAVAVVTAPVIGRLPRLLEDERFLGARGGKREHGQGEGHNESHRLH